MTFLSWILQDNWGTIVNYICMYICIYIYVYVQFVHQGLFGHSDDFVEWCWFILVKTVGPHSHISRTFCQRVQLPTGRATSYNLCLEMLWVNSSRSTQSPIFWRYSVPTQRHVEVNFTGWMSLESTINTQFNISCLGRHWEINIMYPRDAEKSLLIEWYKLRAHFAKRNPPFCIWLHYNIIACVWITKIHLTCSHTTDIVALPQILKYQGNRRHRSSRFINIKFN